MLSEPGLRFAPFGYDVERGSHREYGTGSMAGMVNTKRKRRSRRRQGRTEHRDSARDVQGAFGRPMECVERGLRFSSKYSEEDAVADYLALRPECDAANVRATLAERLFAMNRGWGESVTSATVRKRDGS
jgi:hypothetical protein